MAPHPNPRTNLGSYDFRKMTELADSILASDHYKEAFKEFKRELNLFDGGILEKTDLQDPKDRALHRIIRFCLPFFEIAQLTDGKTLDVVGLSSMHLWLAVWRPLDNLLDSDGSLQSNIMAFAQAFSRAERFQILNFGLDATNLDLSEFTIENVRIELDQPARGDFSQIFRRAIVAETFLLSSRVYSEKTVEIYRRYVNLYGLLHDTMDVVRDAAANQRTLATVELEKCCPGSKISNTGMAEFFRKMRLRFDREFGKLPRSIRSETTLVSRNLRIHYEWLFNANFEAIENLKN